VTVEDDGAGIAADFLPHVFDRFRQADSSTTRAHGGLGLGLAIVKHLAELHGGAVEAHSAGAGRGSRFVVRLPVRLQMAPPAVSGRPPADPISAPPRLDGLRVLVVDDEEDTRDLLGIVLRAQGALVTQVASVREALAALAGGLVDVLVSDIGMPGEDGYSLMGQVRALPAEQAARVPSVALTAYAREEDRRKALAAGFQRHLPKPIEPGELVRVVASVAARR
jgi:CheY-like chemotaxis protein